MLSSPTHSVLRAILALDSKRLDILGVKHNAKISVFAFRCDAQDEAATTSLLYENPHLNASRSIYAQLGDFFNCAVLVALINVEATLYQSQSW